MTLLSTYLSNPKTQKVLRTKPGQQGFSLIELVVVIAVLAVLVAIALPNFLGVSDDASVRSAQQAVINALKECQAAKARGRDQNSTGTDNNFGDVALTDFTVENSSGSTECFGTNGGLLSIVAEPKVAGKFPTFQIDSDGTKTCALGSASTAGAAKTYNLGCSTTTTGTGANAVTTSQWK